MAGPTVEQLGQIFGFSTTDVAANREGRVTTRQRALLLAREGTWVAGVAAIALMVGVGGLCFWVWAAFNVTNEPLGVYWHDTPGTIGLIGLIGLAVFLGCVWMAWDLARDVWRGQVRARAGRMRITPGVVRVKYHSSGSPPAPLFRHGGDGFFDLATSDRRNAELRALAPDPFECAVYRTGGGRLLSVEVLTESEASP
jgi:hypothetical protein